MAYSKKIVTVGTKKVEVTPLSGVNQYGGLTSALVECEGKSVKFSPSADGDIVVDLGAFGLPGRQLSPFWEGEEFVADVY